MSVTINASTSSGLVQSADTSGTVEIQSNGTTKFTVASTGAYGQITSGTAVASTSGTSIDFTSIPSWVKRITVIFNGVSTNGSSNILLQIGSGSIQTTGYAGCSISSSTASAVAFANGTSGFNYGSNGGASSVIGGQAIFSTLGSNIWSQSGSLGDSGNTRLYLNGGSVTLSGALDRVRITTVNGTDTFDAGSINILYEG